MGYRIIYGTEDPFLPPPREKSRLRLLTAVFALALVLAVRWTWPEGTALLRRALLPRESGAFIQLAADIQAGEPIGDAVTAFCRAAVEEAIAQPD